MSYEGDHTENDCDKCHKKVGKNKLVRVPFAYLDCNDKKHEDISEQLGYPKGTGYRQYYVCKACFKSGV
jgi:hypothetical protein